MIDLVIRSAIRSIRLLAQAATITSRRPLVTPPPPSRIQPDASAATDDDELEPPGGDAPYRKELLRVWVVGGKDPKSWDIHSVLRKIKVVEDPVATASQWGEVLGGVAGLIATAIHAATPSMSRAAALAFITRAFANTVTKAMSEPDPGTEP